MNEEVMKVLEMVKSGRITPEEGEKLLNALGMGAGTNASAGSASTSSGGESPRPRQRATMLRIRVDADDPAHADRAKINVNLPLSLGKKLTALTKLIPKQTRDELDEKGIDLSAINLQELIGMFEDGIIDGDLVNIDADDDGNGAKVRIYVD